MHADAKPRNQPLPAAQAVRMEALVEAIPAATHPESLALIAFWEKHRVNGRVLRRADLPCREAAPLLPNVFVLQPTDETAADWRLRLVGTKLTRWLDFDPTGLTISGFYHPDHVAHNADVYRMVTRDRRPHVTQGRLGGVNRDFLKLEIVHLPMEGASEDEMLLLGCISVFEQ